MKKTKRFLGLLLAGALTLASIPAQCVRADVISPGVKVSIEGGGTVTLDDKVSKHVLKNGDVFKADYTEGSKYSISLSADDGSSVQGVAIDGKKDNNIKIGTKTGKYDYEIAKTISNISVTFEKGCDLTVSEYLEGKYNSERAVNFRKAVVEKNKLQAKVDSDFFLKQENLSAMEDVENIGDLVSLVKLSKKDLAIDHTNEVVRSVEAPLSYSSPSSPARSGRSKRSLSSTPPKLVVTYHGEITAYANGKFLSAGDSFSINGNTAFCADRYLPHPKSGTVATSSYIETNPSLRKILYYGFGGPGQVSGWDANALRIATARALSHERHGNGGVIGGRLYSQVTSMAEPPAGFNAILVQIGSPYQDLMFWEYAKKGSLQISKASADPVLTDGNSCYSLEGAEYGVFSNSDASGQVATLTIEGNAWSRVIELDAGTYYLKELKAPKGYALDDVIYPLTVNAGSRTEESFTDKPQSDPVFLLLKKVDSSTGTGTPQGGGSLADAQFTFKFYAGAYSDGVNPADSGVSPSRTWVMKTDSDGFIRLGDSFKVSGDDFYYHRATDPTLPLGTLTMQETKAPIGYKLNTELFVRRITPNGLGDEVHTYLEPTIKEETLDFTITKVQSGTSTVLPNVKFNHTKPNGSVDELTTGPDGKITMKGLTQGTHRIVETKAIAGFEMNTNEFVFEVTSSNTISVVTNTVNRGMSYSESKGNGLLTVENKLSSFKLSIVKVSSKNKPLKGAEFTLYSDRGCTNEISKSISDGSGELSFTGLTIGTNYFFKETKAPAGYRIPVDVNGNVHVYEITTSSTPSQGVFNFKVDGTDYNASSTSGDVSLGGNAESRVINIKVVNSIMMKLPSTGSNMMLPILAAGMSLMFVAFTLGKRLRKQNKKENTKGGTIVVRRKLIKYIVACTIVTGVLVTSISPSLIAHAKGTTGTGVVAKDVKNLAGKATPRGIANFGRGSASISITGNTTKQTLIGKVFNIYKLFNAENSAGLESINYTLNPEFAPALKNVVGVKLGKKPAIVTEYEIIDYIQSLNKNKVEGAKAAQALEGRYSDFRYFIEELRNELVKLNVKSDVVSVTEVKANNGIDLTGLDFGYYVVDEVFNVSGTHSAGSLCMVNTANPTASIQVKSDKHKEPRVE